MKKRTTKILAITAALAISAGAVATLTACGGSNDSAPASSAASTADAASKKLIIGSAAYAGAISDGGIDPAESYAGWSTFRYGIAECLVSFDENMEIQPWVAKSFTKKDDTTWEFVINDNVKFHNGKVCDAAAVKASLERVIKNSDREADVKNMLIDKITAKDNVLTITTTEANPILPNLLCDPLWCIVDASIETDGKTNVIGTGPYKLVKASEEGLEATAFEDYWNGKPKMGTVEVKSITDGDTLTMALQNGEVDAAQELPVGSLKLFQNDQYKISTTATSRTSNMVLNTKSKYLSDEKVRLALAYGINKQDFIDALMSGYGQMAKGFFPESFKSFGDSNLTAPEYNVEKAKSLLKEAGWTDTDNDGYVDKNGENMVLQYFTYSSRQDLPKLAQAFQDDMKDIGIKVELNIPETGETSETLAKKGADKWDINVWQMVTAPNGDAMYMIDSALGQGGYYADPNLKDSTMQAMIDELRDEEDTAKRAALAVKIQQYAIDKGYIIEAFHKEQSWAMIKGVTGLEQHPTDQHEITVNTDINK